MSATRIVPNYNKPLPPLPNNVTSNNSHAQKRIKYIIRPNFKSILRKWGLLDYAHCLKIAGWTDPEGWTELNRDTLITMGFKPGHIATFLRRVRSLNVNKDYQNESQNNLHVNSKLNCPRKASKYQIKTKKKNIDPNTKLELKTEMKKRLLSICDENQSATLICVDMDNLKELNEKDHDAADYVILSVARILRDRSENKGIEAFRFYEGGDEFGLIIMGKSKDEVDKIANEIRQLVQNATPTTISMGIAIRMKNETKEVWSKHAESALKKAKHSGKNSVLFYKDV